MCFVKLLDRSLWEFISNRLLEWWRGFWDAVWNSNIIIITERGFFFLQCDEAADLCQSGLWQCKIYIYFFHFHAPIKSLLWKKQNKSELSPAAITSRPWMGAIPWDELVPSAGVKDDYKPHAPSDTAGLPIKSSCTSCYVKTAALPYVSLQAIYSKKNKTNTAGLSVYNDRAHSETHHHTVQLHLKNPIFFFFFC